MLKLMQVVETALSYWGYTKQDIEKIKRSISSLASRGELPFAIQKTEDGKHAVPCSEQEVGTFAGWLAETYYPGGQSRRSILTMAELPLIVEKIEEKGEQIAFLREQLKEKEILLRQAEKERDALEKKLKEKEEEAARLSAEKEAVEKELSAIKRRLKLAEIKEKLMEKYQGDKQKAEEELKFIEALLDIKL
jgi:DNA repair exonuclease SbcCD ATPase subunit